MPFDSATLFQGAVLFLATSSFVSQRCFVVAYGCVLCHSVLKCSTIFGGPCHFVAEPIFGGTKIGIEPGNGKASGKAWHQETWLQRRAQYQEMSGCQEMPLC